MDKIRRKNRGQNQIKTVEKNQKKKAGKHKKKKRRIEVRITKARGESEEKNFRKKALNIYLRKKNSLG